MFWHTLNWEPINIQIKLRTKIAHITIVSIGNSTVLFLFISIKFKNAVQPNYKVLQQNIDHLGTGALLYIAANHAIKDETSTSSLAELLQIHHLQKLFTLFTRNTKRTAVSRNMVWILHRAVACLMKRRR